MTGYYNAITNPANFGPGGTVSPSIAVTQLGTVTAATLAGANGFISPWWQNEEAASSQAAIINFFLSGGDLILLQDDSDHDSIGAALGVPTLNSDGSDSNGVSPLFVGPFGTATNVSQRGNTGYLATSDILAANGTIGGINGSGEATSAYWAPGQYAPGAGALVVIGDVDMFSSAYGNVDYSPPNDNGVFALNSTAFVVTATVPEPEAGSIMLLGLAALVAARLRTSRRKSAIAA